MNIKRRLNLITPLFLLGLILLSGCGKKTKEPEELSFDELKQRVSSCLGGKKSESAIVYLEQLIAQYPENQEVYTYKFILADLYLKIGRLEEAYNLYKHYTEMYPSEDRSEEAHYKSILSKFYQTLKVSKDCDSSDTTRTVNRCKTYLANNSYAKYRDDVRDIKYTCERRLIDKEIYVFNTYLRRKKFKSAENRINYIRKNFLEDHPNLEAHVLFLESKLAHKKKDPVLAKKKAGDLLENHPESPFTKMANNLIAPKKRFTL